MIKFEEVIAYIEQAPREELLKIRNLSTRKAYPKEAVYVVQKRPQVMNVLEDKTEDYRLAELLWFAVKDNYSFMKTPNLNKWADPIEKLHRVDKHDWKLIQKVIIWATKDEFWKQNVRSGDALRRHFEKCLVKMQTSGALNQPVVKSVLPEPVRPDLPREVVDPNSPGYKKFQQMREELAKKKSIR